MPYASNDRLPPSVRQHLPAHAQDIFREAFNHAFAQHDGDEVTAFRIAWGAVKHRYEKVGSEWVPKDESSHGPTKGS
jgi:cation transport regulator